LSVIGKCPLFEKTQISVDAQYTFWLKFVTNLHEAYVLKLVSYAV